MKTLVLFIIFGLAALFLLSSATELEETERGCQKFFWTCHPGQPPCCSGLACTWPTEICILGR
uniref:U8-theraphotoxin-Cg1a 2 n=1 Tax=Chilobrachys guangxiensis TaxID=278060 RepID=JZ14A_CHIGU|nr:RecName: Full=U8-theraphotoxin-Cg1a 2; Short=U8-TRTX-Cg1a; AltName: Full=Jingzhaotoxin-14; Short=JZTX-14; Flags: Precursor [Chilobrachys guangxiensis]ABY71670.1 cystine knot toxin [Chilobrachys guangxiensis]